MRMAGQDGPINYLPLHLDSQFTRPLETAQPLANHFGLCRYVLQEKRRWLLHECH
jgi:hypothetical protein